MFNKKDEGRRQDNITYPHIISRITYHVSSPREQEVAAISTRRYRKNIIKSKEDQDA